jgi:M6 family metalloprotease-like protein
MKKIIKNVLVVVLVLLVQVPVRVQAQTTELSNVVIFVRFADDAEIDHSFADIDTMFNGRTPGNLSVYNFYDALSYGRLHYNTFYTNNIQNGVIVSYQDVMPRGYFEPYSSSNPIGYTEPNPFMGVSMREAELLGRIISYVDSAHLFSPNLNLDGNGDGMVDNVSFIVKGGTGAWASILWPHMEYFPYDSLNYEPRINGLKINTFNFEFEGAPTYFTAHVFRHEMGHSLNMPDLYHYTNYKNVSPAGSWDMMCYNYGSNHTAAIYKNKILHLSDDPIEITEDGDYTLLSVGSSPSQNCYFIRSHIDPTQWYVLEYRNQEDLFEEGIPGTGLLVARWNDTVTLDYEGMFANAFFDFYNQANQYWIFRPGSSIDTVNGSIGDAYFSQFVGRTSFGPTTDPHPYLTDGTPETCFEITDIQVNGSELNFHVHFFDTGVEEFQLDDRFKVWPNPASDVINVQCTMNNVQVESIEVYDVYGKIVRTGVETFHETSLQTVQINVSALSAGMYFVRVTTDLGVITKPFVKK